MTSNAASAIDLYRDVPAHAAYTVGFGLRTSSTPPTTDNPLLSFRDGASEQFTLYHKTDGLLEVRRGATVLGTSASALPTGSYAFLEMQAVINAATGSFEVRINETSALSATGVNTQATGNAQTSRLQFGMNNDGGFNIRIDDLYINDGDTATPNSGFLGDAQIVVVYPNADGSNAQFTPSSSTDHYALVDEAQVTQADYVSSDTEGQSDLFVFPELVANVQAFLAAQAVMAVNKSGVAPASATPLALDTVNSGLMAGTNAALADSVSLLTEMHEVDIITGQQWTPATLALIEFGLRNGV